MPIQQSYFMQWDNAPNPTINGSFDTKMYSFGGPAGKKNIYKLILTARGGSNLCTVLYRTGIEQSFSRTFGAISVTASGGDAFEILPTNPEALKGINSIQFRIKFWSSQASENNVLRINDINICYRPYREISVNEDE